MCDNEYLAQWMIKERLREAEARGALNSTLRHAPVLRPAQGDDAGDERARPTRLELWWQVSTAWAAHLALPKIWNRF
jgi:hypothetical protein